MVKRPHMASWVSGTGITGILKPLAGYFLLNIGTYLMLRLVAGYSAFDDQYAFLRDKQAYLHLKVWKAAFYIHVFSSTLTLLAGFTQFSGEFLKKHRRLHKYFGSNMYDLFCCM